MGLKIYVVSVPKSLRGLMQKLFGKGQNQG